MRNVSCHCYVITVPPQLHLCCQQQASLDQNNWNRAQDSHDIDKGNQMIFSLLDTEKQEMSLMAS